MRTWDLLKESYNEWDRHNAPELGAALSYYTVLSLAPLLVVVTAVIGLAFGQEAARGQVLNQISDLVGTDGAQVVQTVVANANKPKTGILATVLGLITLFLGASGVFTELRSSLDRIWEAKRPAGGGVMAMIKERFFSFGMVLAVGFLLLVSLVITAGIAAAGTYVGHLLPIPAFVLQILNMLVSFAFITVLFALIYRYVPDERVDWRDVWTGAAITSILFGIGKYAIGLYLGKAGIGSTYGAAGSLVVLLVWIYYSAQIFFFGAEFTHVYSMRHGSHKHEHEPQEGESQVVTVPTPIPGPEDRHPAFH